MAGHVDLMVVVDAPLMVTWSISNEYEGWGATRLLSWEHDGQRASFQVDTPTDSDGLTWTYNVERCSYPEQFIVYSRRWGNPAFLYSVAWWLYNAEADRTKVRCVQDFEMARGAAVNDRRMEEIITGATRLALPRMAARVEAAVADANKAPTASRG